MIKGQCLKEELTCMSFIVEFLRLILPFCCYWVKNDEPFGNQACQCRTFFTFFWIPGFSLIEQYLTVSKTILYEIFFHPDAERVTGNIQLG